MVDVRTLAAAVLGVALGVVFVVAPGTILQVHTAGRLPRDRRGRYGEDGQYGGDRDGEATASSTDAAGDGGSPVSPSQWRRLVQAVGVALILGGAYFAWTLF
jgi:hypothetical protein